MVRVLVLGLCMVLGCDGAAEQPATVVDGELPSQAERSVGASSTRGAASAREVSPVPSPPRAAEPYDRETWPHWVDVDHDCQDARTEVLISESYEDVQFEDDRNCEVSRGAWQCPYTGKLIKQSHLLDVDHLVPLSNAHRSGGARWDRDRRRRYANDLEHPGHLVAVDYVANRSKGDRGPEAWLPPSEDYRCTYVREWVAIKHRWALSMIAAERQAVDEALALCETGDVPPLPQAQARAVEPKQTSSQAKPSAPTASPPSCCRTCKAGKACGDSCIAKTNTCTKPPGCACDG